MRIFLSIFGGLLCVSAVFTGLASTLNVFHQMDVRVENNIDRMNTAHDVNVYETVRRMGVEEEFQDHSVIPVDFMGCTLGQNKLIRPPYYGENITVCEWPVYEEPKFLEPTPQAPTLIKLIPKFEQVTDCASTLCNNHVIRTPPRMPATAIRSGHCTVQFDVDTDGVPQNIVTPYCSDVIFSAPTIASI